MATKRTSAPASPSRSVSQHLSWDNEFSQEEESLCFSLYYPSPVTSQVKLSSRALVAAYASGVSLFLQIVRRYTFMRELLCVVNSASPAVMALWPQRGHCQRHAQRFRRKRALHPEAPKPGRWRTGAGYLEGLAPTWKKHRGLETSQVYLGSRHLPDFLCTISLKF